MIPWRILVPAAMSAPVNRWRLSSNTNSQEAARHKTFKSAIILHFSEDEYLNRWTICIELLNILHLSAWEDWNIRSEISKQLILKIQYNVWSDSKLHIGNTQRGDSMKRWTYFNGSRIFELAPSSSWNAYSINRILVTNQHAVTDKWCSSQLVIPK